MDSKTNIMMADPVNGKVRSRANSAFAMVPKMIPRVSKPRPQVLSADKSGEDLIVSSNGHS
jgi:hypothetical protein